VIPTVGIMPARTFGTEPAAELIEPPRKTAMSTRPQPRRQAFPSTRWSRILAPDGRRDLELLAQDYWRPIRAWLASRLRLDEHRANDLAQEAFAWLLGSRFFERADPARGSFRAFLKTSLANFAIDWLRKQGAEKRGGGHAHEPLDADHDRVDPHSRTPDQVLDDAWRRELLARARDGLQAELEASGRRTYFQVFRDYFLDEADGVDHRALAERYGISRTDVSNWLDHSKKRYRELLRALVSETVTGEDELQQELRWLFGDAGPGTGP
jgi:RNA polymerase sigma-70 factor (ECF subfamily)